VGCRHRICWCSSALSFVSFHCRFRFLSRDLGILWYYLCSLSSYCPAPSSNMLSCWSSSVLSFPSPRRLDSSLFVWSYHTVSIHLSKGCIAIISSLSSRCYLTAIVVAVGVLFYVAGAGRLLPQPVTTPLHLWSTVDLIIF